MHDKVMRYTKVAESKEIRKGRMYEMVKEKVLGIDLGTTFSCMSVVKSGKPIVIPNIEGEQRTASVVAFTRDGTRLVGKSAKQQAVTNPTRTIQSINRMMGSTFYKVKIDDKNYLPEEIFSMILQKLKSDAEMYLGENISKAVITVPAYFNHLQRQAIKNAGEIAGLNIIYFLNNAVASALAYGIDVEQDATVLVYDLGGGTFDISILTLGDGVFEVKSTAGNNLLGGDDFDKRVTDYLIEEFKKKEGVDLRNDPYAMQRLREAAENAKIDLLQLLSTNINLPYITSDTIAPKSLNVDLTRSKLEQLIGDLVESTVRPLKMALSDANLEPKDIDYVLLVGGSSRIPLVQDTVKKIFRNTPIKRLNLDESGAIGAAIKGAMMGGEITDMMLLEVTPLTLGIETLGGVTTHLIERNTTVPTKKIQIFSTTADGQNRIEIHVVEGEQVLAKDNLTLGRFQLTGITPAPLGIPDIEVLFDIDARGNISASAKDLNSGNQQEISIN